MHSGTSDQQPLDPTAEKFYISTMRILNASGIPYLVGGAYALARYSSITRDTKDLDIFVRERDCQRVLDELANHGYQTHLTFPHWLGKAWIDEMVVDVIFSSGNAVAAVDEEWFDRAVNDHVLGVPVKLVAPEEIMWSKAYIMERERFDGSDIAHLLLSCSQVLDWNHLLDRFGADWRVLLVHLMLFGFIYPSYRSQIPLWVLHDLIHRFQQECTQTPPSSLLCQGTLLSREQFFVDVNRWGFADARLRPIGKMSSEELEIWTAPIFNGLRNDNMDAIVRQDVKSLRNNESNRFMDDQAEPPAPAA